MKENIKIFSLKKSNGTINVNKKILYVELLFKGVIRFEVLNLNDL